MAEQTNIWPAVGAMAAVAAVVVTMFTKCTDKCDTEFSKVQGAVQERAKTIAEVKTSGDTEKLRKELGIMRKTSTCAQSHTLVDDVVKLVDEAHRQFVMAETARKVQVEQERINVQVRALPGRRPTVEADLAGRKGKEADEANKAAEEFLQRLSNLPRIPKVRNPSKAD